MEIVASRDRVRTVLIALLSVLFGLCGILAMPAQVGDGASRQRRHLVPYRVTSTGHLLVRCRIDGQGPFNLIVDTGAPTLVLSSAPGVPGVDVNRPGWTTLGRLEVEGGAVIERPRAYVTRVYQLEGMSRMGLSDVEINGVLGYTVLAPFRITLDPDRRFMEWVPLDWSPPVPVGMTDLAATMAVMSRVMELASTIVGTRARPVRVPRGLVGIEVAERRGAVTVTRVLPRSAADRAGMKEGDRLDKLGASRVASVKQLRSLVADLPTGRSVALRVIRSGQPQELSLTMGEGL